MTKIKHLTRAQEYAIGRTLERYLKQDGEYWEYVDDHSDETIARMHQVSSDRVKSYRKAVFGNLKPGISGHTPVSILHVKIADLERRVSDLERRATYRANGPSVSYHSAAE